MQILHNGVIYTAEKILPNHAIVLQGERILDVVPMDELEGRYPDSKTAQKLDLQGANITAGFIDLQINGCGGLMFNDAISVETLEHMQATNVRSGTTSFLPTFITSPDQDMQGAVAVMEHYLSRYKHQALGLHLEGPYLSEAKKGVHQAQYVRVINDEMKAFLCAHHQAIAMITLAAENPTSEYIPEFVQKGIVVSLGHSNATFEQAMHAIELGASCATHLHNAMSPISSGRDLGVVGAVLASDIYAGIIVDGLHVHYANVALDKKIKGDKLFMVTDAIAAAGSDIETFTFVGKQIFVKDGHCYDAAGTLAGASVTMIQSVENAVKQVGITLHEALRMVNWYPARVLKMEQELGDIAAGKVANLTVFDRDFNVLRTAVNGEWVFVKA